MDNIKRDGFQPKPGKIRREDAVPPTGGSNVDKDGFCKGCGTKPCMCEELAHARKHGAKRCIVCDQELGLRGGYAGTGMCGPCCTGEAETLEEKFTEW